MGVSGLDTHWPIAEGRDKPHRLADMARQRLGCTIPALTHALEDKVTEHHRFLLTMLLEEVCSLEGFIHELNERIDESTRPFAQEIERVCQISIFS